MCLKLKIFKLILYTPVPLFIMPAFFCKLKIYADFYGFE